MAIKKNILIITVRADYGGGPEHIFRLLPFITSRYNVSIACPEDEPYYKRFSQIIGEEKIIKIPHRKFSPVSYFKLLFHTWRKNIYVIHSHGKGAGIYSRLLKFFAFNKVFHTFHGLHTGEYSGLGKFLYLNLERFFSLITDVCISVSDSEKQKLISAGICRESNVVLIENGVVLPDYPNKYPEKEPLKVLHITRFDFAKNPELLLEIARELATLKLDRKVIIEIVGDGVGKSELMVKINDAGLSDLFSFAGFQSNLSQYYKSAFIYLSTSRWEGLPLSVLEAKSFGIPPVLTNVTGNSDLVSNGQSGYLYETDSPRQAALYIQKLVENREVWEEMSKITRKDVEKKYNIERSASELLHLYERGRG